MSVFDCAFLCVIFPSVSGFVMKRDSKIRHWWYKLSVISPNGHPYGRMDMVHHLFITCQLSYYVCRPISQNDTFTLCCTDHGSGSGSGRYCANTSTVISHRSVWKRSKI